jgi:hypothetical protein
MDCVNNDNDWTFGIEDAQRNVETILYYIYIRTVQNKRYPFFIHRLPHIGSNMYDSSHYLHDCDNIMYSTASTIDGRTRN